MAHAADSFHAGDRVTSVQAAPTDRWAVGGVSPRALPAGV
jgi:hypothetical protein